MGRHPGGTRGGHADRTRAWQLSIAHPAEVILLGCVSEVGKLGRASDHGGCLEAVSQPPMRWPDHIVVQMGVDA